MNKKQLEKEVLRLKSAGLNKEQIKNVLIKSEDPLVAINKKLYTNGKNLSEFNSKHSLTNIVSDILGNGKFIKDVNEASYSIRHNLVTYRFSGRHDESNYRLSFTITDELNSDNRVTSSIYNLYLNGSKFNFTFDSRLDLFDNITIQLDDNVTLFTALRVLAIGVLEDRHSNLTYLKTFNYIFDFVKSPKYEIEDLIKILNADGGNSTFIDINSLINK